MYRAPERLDQWSDWRDCPTFRMQEFEFFESCRILRIHNHWKFLSPLDPPSVPDLLVTYSDTEGQSNGLSLSVGVLSCPLIACSKRPRYDHSPWLQTISDVHHGIIVAVQHAVNRGIDFLLSVGSYIGGTGIWHVPQNFPPLSFRSGGNDGAVRTAHGSWRRISLIGGRPAGRYLNFVAQWHVTVEHDYLLCQCIYFILNEIILKVDLIIRVLIINGPFVYITLMFVI